MKRDARKGVVIQRKGREVHLALRWCGNRGRRRTQVAFGGASSGGRGEGESGYGEVVGDGASARCARAGGAPLAIFVLAVSKQYGNLSFGSIQ